MHRLLRLHSRAACLPLPPQLAACFAAAEVRAWHSGGDTVIGQRLPVLCVSIHVCGVEMRTAATGCQHRIDPHLLLTPRLRDYHHEHKKLTPTI